MWTRPRAPSGRSFLSLLKEKRSDCPINGMLLVISADSLIRDTPNPSRKKAPRSRSSSTHIQRALDIRFPVFVLITIVRLDQRIQGVFSTM
jgi:type VI secretion system protein ImpL